MHEDVNFMTYEEVTKASPEIDTGFDPDGAPRPRYLNHYHSNWKTRAYLREAIEVKVPEGRSLNGVPIRLLPEHLAATRRLGKSFGWHSPRRVHRDGACPIIYSRSGYFLHPEYDRPLSVRELARIMGFEDSFTVIGNDPVSQLGKGVCAEVAAWLGTLMRWTVTGEVKRANDLGIEREIVRLDKEPGWVPKRPKVERDLYPGETFIDTD